MEQEKKSDIGQLYVFDEKMLGVVAYENEGKKYLLNLIDKESYEFVDIEKNSTHQTRTATKEERRKYWDHITHFEGTNEGVYNKHYDGEDVIEAGTAIVLNEEYITITGTDIPKNGEQMYFSCYAHRLDSWEKCRLPEQTKVEMREATQSEKEKLFDLILQKK